MVMVMGIVMTYGAAKAPAATLFIAPKHVAVQAVLHQVSAFKIVAFNRCDDKYAH